MYLLLDTMVHAVMGNVPAWFVDVVYRNALAKVVLDHFVHECGIFLFLVVVSFHFPLKVFEPFFSHGEIAFKRDD